MPFLWQGAFMDQPFWASLELEACMRGEQRYKNSLIKSIQGMSIGANAQPVE